MTTSESIAQLIERMGRLISNSYHADGFKPVHWEVLRYLSRANEFSRDPSSLGQYLGVTKGSISKTLSTLEERGYIHKEPDDSDKRIVRLELTTTGRALMANSPLQSLVDSVNKLKATGQRDLAAAMKIVLLDQLDLQGRKPFGQCRDCRHHRKQQGKFRCELLDVSLKASSTELICVEFEPSE